MTRATLTIDLAAIAANWRALDALTGPGTETAAVVKADAYGLGLDRVAPALAAAGVKTFFVALAEEGVTLRGILGPEPDIHVFSGYMRGDAEAYETQGLSPLLNSAEQAGRFLKDLRGRPCGLQLDTGMNRLGMEAAELASILMQIPELAPDLVISHLACADEPVHPLNLAQLTAFNAMTAMLPGIPRSLAATGGVLLGPLYHFNLTRPGIGLYGGLPFANARPVVRLDVPVIQARDVLPGETVGYGATWAAAGPSKIATIAAGYADGLIRAMGPDAKAWAGDTACPVVGRVSMDLMTVDVTGLPGAPPTLSLLNEHQTIDDLATAAGTIGYEILTSLGARYERHYKGA
ncbi:MAG: alanine racemase [Paracoccaceae bacterium]